MKDLSRLQFSVDDDWLVPVLDGCRYGDSIGQRCLGIACVQKRREDEVSGGGITGTFVVRRSRGRVDGLLYERNKRGRDAAKVDIGYSDPWLGHLKTDHAHGVTKCRLEGVVNHIGGIRLGGKGCGKRRLDLVLVWAVLREVAAKQGELGADRDGNLVGSEPDEVFEAYWN